ncbi:MAG: hypothetical protein KAS93_05715 [Gammaproteobacteria bacterium]|nr:hypothetical protein [Gammaproteobacteria bacterium]
MFTNPIAKLLVREPPGVPSVQERSGVLGKAYEIDRAMVRIIDTASLYTESSVGVMVDALVYHRTTSSRVATIMNIMTGGLALPATISLQVYTAFAALDEMANSGSLDLNDNHTKGKDWGRVLPSRAAIKATAVTAATGGAAGPPLLGFFAIRAMRNARVLWDRDQKGEEEANLVDPAPAPAT